MAERTATQKTEAAQTTERPQAQAGHRQDPAHRGHLVVANTVVERIATLVASQVVGVVSAGSGFDQVLGHRYPKATATVAGDRARIHVEIAVAWPHPLGQVAERVRNEVRHRVTTLADLRVDAVDVTAAKVLHVPEPARRRVK